jgi:hypothetical protein
MSHWDGTAATGIIAILLALMSVPQSMGAASTSVHAVPAATDVRKAERLLEHVGAGLSAGRTVELTLRVGEPYLRARLLPAIASGAADGSAYQALLELPLSVLSRPYFEAASRSRQPVIRAAGLAGRCRTDRAHAREYLTAALSDPDAFVRAEGIAAAIAAKGRSVQEDIKPLMESQSVIEAAEAAAALVRLGDESAAGVLRRHYEKLVATRPVIVARRGEESHVWLSYRIAYYRMVLASVQGGERQPNVNEDPQELIERLMPFPAIVHMLAEPDGYLRDALPRLASDKEPDVRAIAVRCLGRIHADWSRALLRTRLKDAQECGLNIGGYGWNGSVALLAATYLMEQGDTSGAALLQEHADRTRALFRKGRALPTEGAAEWDPGEYAALRTTAPAVALARAGKRDVRDVLARFVELAMEVGPGQDWESGPAWESYHLAYLGDPRGLAALHRLLWASRGTWYARFRLEAAACIVALQRSPEAAGIVAPAGLNGPLCYPDAGTGADKANDASLPGRYSRGYAICQSRAEH